jgi:uncharacterized protein YlxW (UPF0749 family)
VSAIRRWVLSIPSWQLTLGAALLVLGFLVAAQLAAQGPRVRYSSQERTPLIETATQLQARQEELKTAILDLRTRIQETEGAGQGSAVTVRELNASLQDARIGFWTFLRAVGGGGAGLVGGGAA